MKTSQPGKLVASLLFPLLVGSIAGIFTANEIPEWYGSLNRPWFSPPNWVFGPVWTVLYLIMGYSFFIIWKLDPGRDRNVAILVFMLQLFLNFCWTFIFFSFKMIGTALIEIITLWIMIVVMFSRFYRLKPVSAYLNIPYLVWVSFAALLNAAYFFLNRN